MVAGKELRRKINDTSVSNSFETLEALADFMPFPSATHKDSLALMALAFYRCGLAALQ